MVLLRAVVLVLLVCCSISLYYYYHYSLCCGFVLQPKPIDGLVEQMALLSSCISILFNSIQTAAGRLTTVVAFLSK